MEDNKTSDTVKNVIENIRKISEILSLDALSIEDTKKIEQYKISVYENLDIITSEDNLGSYEQLLVTHSRSLLQYLEENGFSVDAFYNFQLENGV